MYLMVLLYALVDEQIILRSMSSGRELWISYLCVMYFFAALGIVRERSWGIVVFHIVTLTQIYAYGVHKELFGRQAEQMAANAFLLALYWKLVAKEKRGQQKL